VAVVVNKEEVVSSNRPGDYAREHYPGEYIYLMDLGKGRWQVMVHDPDCQKCFDQYYEWRGECDSDGSQRMRKYPSFGKLLQIVPVVPYEEVSS
jgi:hypothetical protein